ncbi:hypothetical protein P171DRAFT_526502 [Karstenula rhodostoma CBS 690.94]|uniref:Uncharacterized protein n=1 Tax=Karstenula rhodostoma CBS 690.94 TaxID=1392251 RepID=A0A9P4P6R7_9PLEO|nr:hypothetical protein P171DRAFT_526502 [Karstenula rhodostoma CBS 690.94]
MPSSVYSSPGIPPALRRQLSSVPPAHLDELISLALEATALDPSIDFLAAVKALWRCNAHNPRSYSTMDDDGSDPEPENTAQDGEQHTQQDSQHHVHEESPRFAFDTDTDTDMPDAPSPTPSPPTSPSASHSPSKLATPPRSICNTKSSPTPQNDRPTHTHQRHPQPHSRTLVISLLRDGTHPDSTTVSSMNWQRREQLALAQAYLQAFDLWPHARSSERRCEGFLARYVNL